MIYIGNLDSLSEKDYKAIANDAPDKLLLFAKKGAAIPVTQAVKFGSLTAKVNEFEIVEAESIDLKAYYIGKQNTENGIKLLGNLGFSAELIATVCPQQRKRRSAKTKPEAAEKSVAKEKAQAVSEQVVLEDKVTDKAVSKGSAAEKETKPKSKSNAAVINEPEKEEPAAETVSATSTKKLLNDEGANMSEIVRKFFKQMSVRVTDLKRYKGSNENLVFDIANVLSIMEAKNTKDLLSELELKFTEEDAKTICTWVKPNIKNLTLLAEDVLQEM